MSNNPIDLNTFANGAFAEKLNAEMRKVYENIKDPNTDPKKPRTVTMTLKVTGDEERDLGFVSVGSKSSLAPHKDVATKIILDRDNEGKVVGKELKSGIKGQMYIDADTGEVLDDVGSKPSEEKRNIVGFNRNAK
jgi:hypothetical protein